MGAAGVRTDALEDPATRRPRGGAQEAPHALDLARRHPPAFTSCCALRAAHHRRGPGLLQCGADPPGPASGGYLGFADRIQAGLEPLWDESAGRYRSGQRETEAMLNANLLLTHAVAALKDHSGPARNDHRARRIARALVSAPTFAERLPRSFEDPQRHTPGFVDTMDAGDRNQHLVIDAEIVDGLVHAWLARRELGLSAETADSSPTGSTGWRAAASTAGPRSGSTRSTGTRWCTPPTRP